MNTIKGEMLEGSEALELITKDVEAILHNRDNKALKSALDVAIEAINKALANLESK